jgi:hypothetical protein
MGRRGRSPGSGAGDDMSTALGTPPPGTVVGDAMFQACVAYKRAEWEVCHSALSAWELEPCLEFF